MNKVLAARLRKLADRMETADTPDKRSDVGIDLEIVMSDWKRLCFGQANPLIACKDRSELAVAA